MHQISKIYFVTKLYMFRASSVPIIRSYQLYTWQLVRFMQLMWPMPRRVRLELNIILFTYFVIINIIIFKLLKLGRCGVLMLIWTQSLLRHFSHNILVTPAILLNNISILLVFLRILNDIRSLVMQWSLVVVSKHVFVFCSIRFIIHTLVRHLIVIWHVRHKYIWKLFYCLMRNMFRI